MKRLLFGVGLVALSAPAWGQVVDSEVVDIVCTTACSCADTAVERAYCDEPGYIGPRERDEIVSVGERFGVTEIDKLTSPVTAIDPSVRDLGTISQELRAVPGLSVNSSGPDTGLTQLRLRGAEANQIVVLVDGVEVANPADGAFDFGGLRAEDVLRVEVLRGEQSALYGSDAVAGVINIVTRARAGLTGWRGTVEAGSRDNLEGNVSAGISLGGAVLSVTGNVFITEGYDVSASGDEDDGASSRGLRLALNKLQVGNVELGALVSASRRTSEFDEDADFDGRIDDTDSVSDVDLKTYALTAETSGYGLNYRASASRSETVTDTRGGFPTETTGTRDQVTLLADYNTLGGFEGHGVTALAEYEREEYEFEGDPDTPSNDTWGVAGDYRFQGDALTLTASARYDSNDLFDDSFTWRAGAGYRTGFGRFTASLGTAVKNPTLIELFGFFPSSNFVGNPDLQAEESFGYNLGWSYDLEEGRISANYFRSELEDEVITVFNPDFTTGVANLDTDSTREGVEIEGNYRVGDVNLRGSVSFLDSDQDGVEEIRRPDFLASGTVSWQPTDALSLTVFADHTGSQLDTDFATFTNIELDAFTLVGATLGYDVSDAWQIYARGTNLLDEDYEEVVGYRSPGAAVFVGLRADY